MNKREKDIFLLEEALSIWFYKIFDTDGDAEDIDCPLCEEYMANPYNACLRCPIFQVTKNKYCYGTPYHDWVRAYRAYNKDTEYNVEAEKEFLFLEGIRDILKFTDKDLLEDI